MSWIEILGRALIAAGAIGFAYEGWRVLRRVRS